MAEIGERAQVTDLHRAAIKAARPDLAYADLVLRADGWDCLAIEADGRWVFKFPHHRDAGFRLRREPLALDLIRPVTNLSLPDMRIHEGPPLMSVHEKVPGSQVGPPEYDGLSEDERARLADDLARFFAAVHSIDTASEHAREANAVRAWPMPDALLDTIGDSVPLEVRNLAGKVAQQHAGYGADAMVFGQFDTHGWNMAYDTHAGRLHGLFDFAGAGIGPLHRDLSYLMFVSLDLTTRVVRRYNALTGRSADLLRAVDCHGALRVVELAEACADGEPLERFVAALLRFDALRNAAFPPSGAAGLSRGTGALT